MNLVASFRLFPLQELCTIRSLDTPPLVVYASHTTRDSQCMNMQLAEFERLEQSLPQEEWMLDLVS